ncbi:sulfurtransferase [Carnobacterium divergens]|uniref:Sulfurtransferase n=2 Tax=Carnobacterium divergens TaxID=2748 RepID=A0A7Z8CWI6_CARDV|nr:sulfurtransferase [Carnobacterium divergens]TFI75178.1 sulfurtransferase [Carnobacterium divergens]TFI81002.1 sulfurtransferase [Carnobacterium divergens]TFI93409.1 sulfurtransferase [Carnobacterium divergens]TFJ09441.1 sulfurtransferase [Carnobacterium divergens]
MNGNIIVNIILAIILLGMIGYEVYQHFNRKRAAVILTEEEFRENMRKVQVIDVREKPEFDAGHILGARNIPYSGFKTRMVEIRKDIPVYLYDQKKSMSGRAAVKLRKAGYTKIYRLKDGYQNWNGKIKKK